MPEMRFTVSYPDGIVEECYSPSLIVREYLSVGGRYALDDFLSRSRTALTIASERVLAKYGFSCSAASDQLERIEARVAACAAGGEVEVISFDP